MMHLVCEDTGRLVRFSRRVVASCALSWTKAVTNSGEQMGVAHATTPWVACLLGRDAGIA
jgi:hypothetical protein